LERKQSTGKMPARYSLDLPSYEEETREPKSVITHKAALFRVFSANETPTKVLKGWQRAAPLHRRTIRSRLQG